MEKHRDRFMRKVNVSAECWTWTGSRNGGGYGTFYLDGKAHKAHRVSYELANGPIPDGMCVCHRCDNPPCVNPAHLFLGTKGDNLHDMIAKGRGVYRKGDDSASRRRPERLARGDRNGSRTKPEKRPRGENHSRSQLTDAKAGEAKRRLANGESRSAVARALGATYAAIHGIYIGASWAHVQPSSTVVEPPPSTETVTLALSA